MPPVATAAPVAGFTTGPTSGDDAIWTGLRWRHLDEDDPARLVRSVVAWDGGWLATGEPIADGSSATSPLWRSADGRSWEVVSSPAQGAGVVGAADVGGSLVVVTLQVVPSECFSYPAPFCHIFAGPLRIWSSDDGRSWTERPSPVEVASEAQTTHDVVASLVAGEPTFLFVAEGERRQVAASTDGTHWSAVAMADPSTGPPFHQNSVGRLGSSVIGIGETEHDGDLAAVIWSSTDGANWDATTLPSPGDEVGTVGGTLVVGAAGVLARGSFAGDGGPSFWWASDGDGWTLLDDYPPLGAWVGDGAGSGGVADGFVVGDGQRLIAYHGGDKPAAWRSTDAQAWTPISVEGAAPEVGNGGYSVGSFVLSPLGLLFLADDGNVWLAEPLTD